MALLGDSPGEKESSGVAEAGSTTGEKEGYGESLLLFYHLQVLPTI